MASEERGLPNRDDFYRAILQATAPQPPGTLYHYTRRAGLLGLLEQKKLWASSARHLNDATELATADDLVRRVLAETSNLTSKRKRLIEIVERDLERIQDLRDVFVFSLSEKPDLLSQWRAYSRAGDGYCIGFSAAALRDVAPGWRLARCEYDDDGQYQLISRVFEDCQAWYQALRNQGEGREEAYQSAAELFIREYTFVAPVLKHPTFSEEREWRLINVHSNVWGDNVRFRDTEHLLIPYLEVGEGDTSLPIWEVVIGPTPHPDLEERTLSGLLTVSGLPECKVRHSRIPFRDW